MGVSDDKIIMLIGKLVVEYSDLITLLDLLSYEQLEIEQSKWQIFSSKISDKIKIECFSEVLKLKKSEKSEKYFADVDDLVKRISAVEESRNQYLHSTYIQTSSGENKRLKLHRKLNKPGIFDINYNELEKLVEDIIVLRKDVVGMVGQVNGVKIDASKLDSKT